MKNIEKYAEEIVKADYKFALTRDNTVVDCVIGTCANCQFNLGTFTACSANKTKWLMENFKECILTEEEKSIKKNKGE